MSVFDEYRSKLKTAEKAVSVVKSGDWVDYASMNGFPKMLDAALARRRDELHHVKIRGNLIPGPVQVYRPFLSPTSAAPDTRNG